MAKLVYSMLMSIDGYIEDNGGNFDWAVPSEEAHAFINDLQRPQGTYLYGRRMYETMTIWEHDVTLAEQSPVVQDFAGLWQSADKIVYSTTLEAVSTRRTRIERSFDPAEVRHLKATAASDICVSGPDLAGQAMRAGLVDELHLFTAPVVVGGGKRALPDGVHQQLDLLGERRFDDGMVFLHYRVAREAADQ